MRLAVRSAFFWLLSIAVNAMIIFADGGRL